MTASGSRSMARLLRTRWLMRLPIGLFRARLGWIFGGRLCMIEHRGRTSGERRFVVLEVVGRAEPDLVVVASGLGPGAQWFRNLQANGVAFVSIGMRSRVAADVRLLDAAGSRSRLEEYARLHPAAWEKLHDAMAIAQGLDEPDIPIVELALRT
ncbi:MAG: nitroreductase family deazaflavin-dependent oxidoreductase [Schumannella sp.]